MDLEAQTNFLRRTLQVLPALTANLTDEQWRWKPPSGNWSILEVVCHLVVEETDDFRPRLSSTLADPTKEWTSYDPEGIVVSQSFNENQPKEWLAKFQSERNASIEWLESLSKNPEFPVWENVYQHPTIGPIKAGDLFVSWVAHDQLHVRQIAKRCFEMIASDDSRFKTDYAGNWGA